MATDRDQAEASLKAGGFDPKIHWASGASEWQRGNLKAIVWERSEFTLQGKHTELPALLTGPALTPAEVEALAECANAMGLLAKASGKEANQERARGHARTIQGLLNRMGTVPSPSTPETGEES